MFLSPLKTDDGDLTLDYLDPPAIILPDATGVWTPAVARGGTSSFTLRRHQPGNAAAAPPNSVYARECGATGRACGHCWLVPSHDYDSRQLQQIAVRCDDAVGVLGGTSGTDYDSLTLNGVSWKRQGAAPPKASTTPAIHTVHMVYVRPPPRRPLVSQRRARRAPHRFFPRCR